MVLQGLQPARVFYWFETLCGIPHGSGNTKEISDFCVEFAIEHGLRCSQDVWNNVVIRKPASVGYEEHPPVILQGHLDMVCEKDEGVAIDFTKDGLALRVEGDWISADGTTLGGDDGIAVAMALAILEDDTLAHPPLEVLFTTDEETGMYGAAGLDPTDIKGRTLINVDSEQEGTLTVGCAGGARVDVGLPLRRGAAEGPCVQIVIDGLQGGHSGVEIHKGRQNANKLMGELLRQLPEGWQLVSLSGGQKDNAIPRLARAQVLCHGDVAAVAAAFAAAKRVDTDPGLQVTVTPAGRAAQALSAADSRRAAALLCALPDGVQAYSRDIEGLVETSLNLGILRLDADGLHASFAVRSGINREKDALLHRLQAVAAAHGAIAEPGGAYPAWEYRADSPLRDVMVDTYRQLTGTAPTVEIIHAGLECGLLSDKLPGLDAVSCGPDMQDIHTSRERLSISSTARTYQYLCRVLERL